MKLHERHAVTSAASVDLNGLTLDWLQRHDLTWAEAVRILANRLSQLSVYPVRCERHPGDPDKKADEA